MAKAVRIPLPADIKNWPDDPKMKVFLSNGTLYGGYRLRKRDPQTHRQHEQKVYSGRIIDNVYYPMEEFREKFTRTGERREKVAAEAQVKAAGLPPEVANRVIKRDAERQILMTNIADMLGDFGGTLNEAPEKIKPAKTFKKSPKPSSENFPDAFEAGDADAVTDIDGVQVADVKASGAGATLVSFPTETACAAILRLGKTTPVWGAERVLTTGRLTGSVFLTREADAAAAVARLWDKQDVGVVATLPGDERPRLTVKDLLGGSKKFTAGQSGVGLGLTMGLQSASRSTDGVGVGVLVTGTSAGLADAVSGEAVLLAVTDAVLNGVELEQTALSVLDGFSQAGWLAEGVVVIVVSTGTSERIPALTKIAAAAAEAARAAGRKAKKR